MALNPKKLSTFRSPQQGQDLSFYPNGMHRRPGTENVNMPSPRSSPRTAGRTNLGYQSTSADELNRDNIEMRQSQNGQTNRGFIPSVVGYDEQQQGYPSSRNNNSSPVPQIRTKEGFTHDPNRYDTSDRLESKSDTIQPNHCGRKKCCCAFGIIVGVIILVAGGVIAGLYFGKVIFQPVELTTTGGLKTTPSVLNTTTSVLPNGTHLSPTDGTSTTVSMSTTAPPLPDGDLFSGQLSLDRTWTHDLAEPTSPAFQNISLEFSTFMNREMSSNPRLGSSYNSTQVVSLQNGSIIVVFIIRFNEPVVRVQVQTEISLVLTRSTSSSLPVVDDSLVIEDFMESEACRSDSLLLCDGTCRNKTEIACNSQKDCSDWYDEFNCPGESVTCDFEQSQTCGYTIHENNNHQYKWIYNSGDTASLSTGPDADNTYANSTGHYYYTEWCQTCTHGDIAMMSSPWYVTRQDACLSFYYNMKGHPTEMGPFYLYSYDKYGNEKVLWTRQNPDTLDRTGVWRQVNINIPAGSYQFTFASFFDAASELGDKAIDDILMRDGTCPAAPDCNGTLYCPITNECLQELAKPLCNGKFECPDESDERDCPDQVYACSFEDGNLLSDCSLTTQSADPVYQWAVVYSATPVTVQGTYFDNTFRNDLGHYVTALPGQIAIGTETTLKIDLLMSGSQERCLQFAYNINNEGPVLSTPGTLKVFARKIGTGEVLELWSYTGNAGRDWAHVFYSIPALDRSYNIEFVAVRGNGDGIVISLDDITVMNGFCKCADPGRRQCPDRTCIPEEWFCDGDSDCADGEDEVNCPVCDLQDFQCRDRSCISGGNSIRCDGTYNCADGSDEDVCAIVDSCATEDCIKLAHTDGRLLEVCSANWDPSLNTQICRYLYKGAATGNGETQALSSSSKFLRLTNPSTTGFINRFTEVNSCPGDQVVKVFCEEETCGRRHISLTPYIIGGTETTQQGRWPWQVGLKYAGLHTCGAILLRPNWIITAAHCVNRGRESRPDRLKVYLGTTQVNPGQPNSIVRDVKRVIINKNFTNDVLEGSDIALLHIEQAINYTDMVKPACLPDHADDYSSRSRCFLTGWGKDGLDSYPSDLQEAKFKLTSTAPCNASWDGVIQDSMVCAGYNSGTIRSCDADSGGPLVCLDKYKRWSLVGITSFGPSGCLLENQKNDVFTRVSSYSDWIEEIVNFQFNCTNGNILLDSEDLCNGADNCGDNSDEILPCTRTIECDFESKNYCGYTLGDWKAGTGLASTSGPLDNTGPSFDHTSGLADSSHTYMVTSVDGAVLSPPDLNKLTSTCLQMYYYLSYDSRIQVKKSATNEVFSEIGGAADVWQWTQVTLPNGLYSLEFVAIIPQSSYVAIDDVNLLNDQCVPDTCPRGMFKCQSNNVCIDSKYNCNGVSNCLDSSDEVGCLPAVDSITCSFDEPLGCGFRQSNDDDFNWRFRYGDSDSSEPSSGHGVDGEVDVSYLIATALQPHSKAKIIWPLKVGEPSCMTFWYIMYGDSVGTMEVMSAGIALWQEFGNQGREWVRIRVPVDADKSVEITTQSGSETSSYSAVDDITVVKGNCPAQAACNVTEIQCSGRCIPAAKRCDGVVDCFNLIDEISCGWTLNCNFDSLCSSYTITKNLPPYAWRLSDAGGFLFADSGSAQKGSRTEYTSAPLSLTAPQCLTFRYMITGIMYGNPELRVILTEPTIQRDTILWRMSLAQQTWATARVTVNPVDQTAVKLFFQSFYGGNKSADVSLDDIQLADGQCSFPACPGQFLCPYEETCVPTTVVCDGVNDCHSGLDEKNCGDVAERIDCDFDTDFCDWMRPSVDLSLEREAGSTALADTGPSYDHTRNNRRGSYVYLDSTSIAGQAQLISPTIELTSQHCFSFYYYMTGVHIGYLNLTNLNGSSSEPLITIIGAQERDGWHVAKVTLNATSALTLQFSLSSRGLFSNTAIDDITLRQGSCDCTNEFQCSVSGECFDTVTQCDHRRQCKDGSDEVDCGCPGEDIRCKLDGECYPVDFICEDPSLYGCLQENQTINCNCNSSTDNTCPGGFCYHRLQICDGEVNCPDQSDEPAGCAENCADDHVACDDLSYCIPYDFFCDGQMDCTDNSDEKPGCRPIATAAPSGR